MAEPSDEQHEPDEIGDDNTVLGPVPRRMGSRNTLVRDADALGNVIHNGTEAIGYGAQAGEGSVAIGSRANAGVDAPGTKRRFAWTDTTRFRGLLAVTVVGGLMVAFTQHILPFGTSPMSVKGNNNVLVGTQTTGVDGSDNTIVNSTNANGNVILNHGGTAIGAGAHVDGTSVAIGAGASAGGGR